MTETIETETNKKKTRLPTRHIWRFAWHYWRKHPVAGIASVVLMLLAVGFDIAVPPITGKLIDALSTGQPDNPQITDLLVAFAVVSAGYHMAYSAAIYVWNWFASRNLFAIVTEVSAKVQGFSSDWHGNSFAGATVRKVTRGMWSFDQFEDTIYMGLLPAFVMLIGMTIVLAVHIPLVGLIAFAIGVLYTVVSIVMSVYLLKPRFENAAEMDTAMGATLADQMTGIATIKAFATEDMEQARFHGVATTWQQRAINSWQMAQTTNLVRGFIRMGMMVGMVGVSVWLWQQGKATPGDVVFALTSFFMIAGYLRDIGQQINHLQRTMSDIADAVSFWMHENDVVDAPDATKLTMSGVSQPGQVSFHDVTFRYNAAGRTLYNGLSVDIAAGEKVALVGPSGSGKSTFTKLLQRLYDIQDGAITIDGQNIAHVTQGSLRGQIALVPQEPILFHRTLAENIAYARPGASRSEIEAAAAQAYAHDFISQLPQGYETLVGERGVKLSGGERQRVAIARAILADRPILILDEATSSLDSESEHAIQRALQQLMEGRTTFVIAHRLSTIRNVDRILVFEKGQIVEQGTHDVLIGKKDGRYAQLHALQALELNNDEGGN